MKYNRNYLCDSNNQILIQSFNSTVPIGKLKYREHHHTECELSTFISGTGIYSVNDKTYEYKAGDVFFFSGNEVHCITDIRSNFKLLNIQFDPRILWNNEEDFTALKIIFARNKNFQNKIDINNPCTEKIRNKIMDIEKELREKKEGYKTAVKYNLFSALIDLVREYDYIDKTIDYSSFKNTVTPMENALNYINEHLSENLTLKSISDKASLSQTYFSSVFKKLNGVSLWEYVTIKRVERAINLLRTTNYTKLDIAMQCGFNSSSNFYKAFEKITGKKPSYYTKEIKN